MDMIIVFTKRYNLFKKSNSAFVPHHSMPPSISPPQAEGNLEELSKEYSESKCKNPFPLI
jgi:hypothetical protein